MKRLFGALIVTGMLLGVSASHQVLADHDEDDVCMCEPFINEIRSNGIVLLLGHVKCVPESEAADALAKGGLFLPDPSAVHGAACCGVCRDEDGDEAPCPPID